MKIVSLGNDFNTYTCQQWADIGASYPIADDRGTAIWSEFGVGVVPLNVIIDIDGIVRYSAFGYNESAVTAILDELLSVVSVDDQTAPDSYRLISNYPNPFNAGTTITFTVQQAAVTELEIYDSRGQRIQTLLEGNLGAGEYQLDWNALDDQGVEVQSGVYFARLKSGSNRESQKLVLLK